MKMKMYQVPVTEMYAVRAQVIMDGTVMKGDNAPGSDYTAPGAGELPPGAVTD